MIPASRAATSEVVKLSPDLVHRPVAPQDPVVFVGKAMPPCSDVALSLGDRERNTLEVRLDRLVTCREKVLREQQVHPTAVPAMVAIVNFPLPGPVHLVLDHWQIAISMRRRKKGQCVEHVLDRMSPSGSGFYFRLHSPGKIFTAPVKNLLRLAALPGGRRAITSESFKLDRDIAYFSSAPNLHCKFPFLRLRFRDGPGKGNSGIGIKFFSSYPDNDVAHFQHFGRRRLIGDFGDQDLACFPRFATPSIHPAPRSGWTEIPVMRFLGNFIPLREIRNGRMIGRLSLENDK